jgi:hypothetical protein
VNAQTGAILSLEKKKLMFYQTLSKGGNLKGLESDKTIKYVLKFPSEIIGFPKIKVRRKESYRIIQLRLGWEPISSEMVILPVWKFKIKHKRRRKKRNIVLDSATGRILSGYF